MEKSLPKIPLTPSESSAGTSTAQRKGKKPTRGVSDVSTPSPAASALEGPAARLLQIIIKYYYIVVFDLAGNSSRAHCRASRCRRGGYQRKTYVVDAQGFLIDAEKWDIHFAINKAVELKLPGGRLTERHWKIVRYLRDAYRGNGVIPTVYRTCEDTGIDLESLADLFPDGYHRGAVKVAGLRL